MLTHTLKHLLSDTSTVGAFARRVRRALRSALFPGSRSYWEQRYAAGGHSGAGSYTHLAEFKAEILNTFVTEAGVHSVIEYGCGDGNQLEICGYPAYLGFDVSPTAVSLCQKKFRSDPSKSFRLMDAYAGETADLCLSLDVVYHLVEDAVFDGYMQRLFDSADRYVIVYSSNTEQEPGERVPHVRHREFTRWVAENRPAWKLIRHVPNRFPYGGSTGEGSFADFFMFERVAA